MDDIYDDLDNYDDLNIIEELKKENHDLKLKLEQYTIAMSDLQKILDKLSSDYKKLEMNYSSLLKTAKVEIERKTKIITDLNIEKDRIVINALRNRNINDIRKLTSVTNTFTKNTNNDSSGKGRSNVPLAESTKGKSSNVERKDDIRFSSVDTTTTSGNTDVASKLMQLANSNPENTELWSDRMSDTKENMTQRTKHVENNSKSLNTCALSIKNRRKSMPSVRSHAKYSSDEDCEDRYCSNDSNRKKIREDPSRQNVDKNGFGRHRYKGLEDRNKSSETSNVDDKYYGYPGPSRDSYHKTRDERHYGNNKNRSRNKYDVSLRFRRQSPEKAWRASRNDNFQRQEYNRYRVLESPPGNFHHYQQRNQEMRLKRDRDDVYELEKRDMRENYEKYSSRQKTSSDHYDEPISKRQRTDSFHKFSEEELRFSHERPLEKPGLDLYENLHQDLSCQSPDYTVTEAVTHPVREIMNTASTPLEDPRIHSRKYILKTSDDNVELTTVTGRNVDLKVLDTTLWNNTQPEVPKSLRRRPSQGSEDMVKEIYMDIENPVSNMSTESGGIVSFEVEDNLIEVRDVVNDNIQRHEQKVASDPDKQPNENEHTTSLTKYRIPKLKTNELSNEFHASHEKGVGKLLNKAEHSVKNAQKDRSCKGSLKQDNDKKNPIEKECEFETTISKNLNYSENFREPVPSMKELIAGDLELSDETCDNLDVHKNTSTEKPQRKENNTINTEHVDKMTLTLNSKVHDIRDNKLDKNIEKEMIQAKPCDTVKDDSKRRSSKKKLPKNKDTSKIAKLDATDKDADKINKKDLKDPKEIKTKFSELFGDSSSLITPEDLGILAVQAQTQPSASYVPICEDAQDAVDITVANTAKVQTRLSKLKSAETIQSQECLETKNNKSSNDTKKKTRKNSAQGTDKSKIREVYQSLTADKLLEKDELPQKVANEVTKEIVTSKIPDESAEKQIEATITQESGQVESSNTPNEVVDEQTINKRTSAMLPMPNVLMKALATSTPQKEPQEDDPGIGLDIKQQAANCQSSSKETSHDNVAISAASQSSISETINSQNDDVPDVRIFVKRKRRVKGHKQS